MVKPTREQIYALYAEIKTGKMISRKDALILMGASSGVSAKTAEHWIDGYRNCPPACWRCLNWDFRGVDVFREVEAQKF